MSELISGKEAKLAWAKGEVLEWRAIIKNSVCNHKGEWSEIQKTNPLSIFDNKFIEFRLKPSTITINGIEVPASADDYEPHTFMFVLNSLESCEYSKVILDESDDIPAYWWRTEEEIKQVVEALRSIFNK